MLRLVLPKGSLEKATLQLFEDADLAVVRSLRRRLPGHDRRSTRRSTSRSCARRRSRATSPTGLFDLGITGRDWIEETGADVVTLTRAALLEGDRAADPHGARRRRRLAVAVGRRTCPPACACTPSTPSSPGASSRSTASTRDISLSYGATEAKIPEIADAVVEITETGRALRAAGLQVLDTILVSYTELIANPVAYADADKRKAMEQLQTLLSGALEARGRVLVKLNVDEANLKAVIDLLPALKSPTVSKLFGEDGYAVETVVAKSDINTLIPALKDARRDRHPRAADLARSCSS